MRGGAAVLWSSCYLHHLRLAVWVGLLAGRALALTGPLLREVLPEHLRVRGGMRVRTRERERERGRIGTWIGVRVEGGCTRGAHIY